MKANERGTTAEAPAMVIANRDEAKVKWFFGAQTWMHATADSTGGAMAVIEQIGVPGIGSPYHVHHNEDESFYVIEGTLRFVSGEKSWLAGPGTWAFLPRNIPHGFEIVGEAPARFLLLVTPGGFDSFVRELWEDASSGPPEMGKVMEAAGRYGLEILGPLPV